jgi:hypothetical protein
MLCVSKAQLDQCPSQTSFAASPQSTLPFRHLEEWITGTSPVMTGRGKTAIKLDLL